MEKAKVITNDILKSDYGSGYFIAIRALEEPLRQIARNAGKDEGVVLHEVVKGGANSGYDALNDEKVADMFEAGIIDPVKVTRCALENAASAVALLLTTEVAIADEPKEETTPAGGHGGGMGGMDY